MTQELQSRGTAHTGQLWARHTAHRSGKVRERWHSLRAQSCEDREFKVGKRGSPRRCPTNRSCPPGQDPTSGSSGLAADPFCLLEFCSAHGALCNSHGPFPYLPHHSEDTHAQHQPSQLSPTAQGQAPTEQGSNCKPQHPPACHRRLPLLPPAMLLQ